jgi:predicted GIY-YIG superfamily endonuclease
MKEFLYVGHYLDKIGNYILKIGTTNDLERRRKEHNRAYKNAPHHKMAEDGNFEYDWYLPLTSRYSTLRYEDKNRELWKQQGIGIFIQNDRFICDEKPEMVEITIRKTYQIAL